MFAESIQRNAPNFVVDHKTEVVLTCGSPFRLAFKNFSGKKISMSLLKNKKTLYGCRT